MDGMFALLLEGFRDIWADNGTIGPAVLALYGMCVGLERFVFRA